MRALRILGVLNQIGEKLRRHAFSPYSAGSAGAPALANLPEITFDLSFLTSPPPPELHDRTSADEVGEITFDLSFLMEGRAASRAGGPETVEAEPAEGRHLQTGDHRERKERNLEEWFRQRAAEVARRAAERQQLPPADAFRPVGQAG
jgi:hypothetical protein